MWVWLCTHILVSPLLHLWAEEKIFHLESQSLSKSTVGKKGGTEEDNPYLLAKASRRLQEACFVSDLAGMCAVA